MRVSDRDSGFTLVELMVVMIIVGVLVAIAVPVFLGQRESAQQSGSKAQVRNALLSLRDYYTVNEEFTADLDKLGAINPAYFKVNGTDGSEDPVVVRTPMAVGSQVVCISGSTDGKSWFAVYEDAFSGTLYGRDTVDPFTICAPAEAAGFSPKPQDGWG